MTRVLLVTAAVSIVLGTALALAPFWWSLRSEWPPAGEACWFEHDPGSGRSAVGIEHIEWGPAPQRVCTAIGPVDLPTAGPAFEQAAARASDGERAGEILEVQRRFPFYGAWWPVAAVAFSVGIWLVMLAVAVVVRADRRTLDGMARS